MAFLEVRGIRKSFGQTSVLKGIDFDLEQGEVLSIIGSSGSGKTTLLRCLNYLETADEGVVSLNGDCIFNGSEIKMESAADIRSRRLNFGMVFQQFNLFPQYTALQNVMLAPKSSINNQIAAQKLSFGEKRKMKAAAYEEIETEAIELLTRVGLKDKMNNYPCELSGGQCQRVAIARALAMRPNILCFDEPTSALDPELTGEVLKVIRELKEKTNSTMIIVTHEMEFAKNVSDKVIFMDNGVIAEAGTPYEVFENPKSEKLRNFIKKAKREDEVEDEPIVEDRYE